MKYEVAWTTKPLGGGVKSLVVRPLKKPLFLCVSSLTDQSFFVFFTNWKCFKLDAFISFLNHSILILFFATFYSFLRIEFREKLLNGYEIGKIKQKTSIE